MCDASSDSKTRLEEWSFILDGGTETVDCIKGVDNMVYQKITSISDVIY